MNKNLTFAIRLSYYSAIVSTLGILIFFGSTYLLSVKHLKANPPTVPQNRKEETFYFRPLALTVRDRTNPRDLIEYLKSLPYVESDTGDPATFKKRDDVLEIFSSNRDRFPDLKIRFAKSRVSSIEANGAVVQTGFVQPMQISTFSRFLSEFGTRYQQRQIPLEASAINDDLRNTVSSVEDRRFFPGPGHYAHHGCDPITVAYRALRGSGGGSVITTQVLKNNIFKQSQDEFWNSYLAFLPPTLQRKAVDCQMSLAAESLYTKDEIFRTYVNLVPFGASAGVEIIGFEAAAQEYFNKHVSDITVPELAEIVGMINGPSLYLRYVRNGMSCRGLSKDVCRDLLERRSFVLQRLRTEHPDTYSAEFIASASKEPLKIKLSSELRQESNTEAISRGFLRFAARTYGNATKELPNEGQTQFITSLDVNMQRAAFKIVSESLDQLQPAVQRACTKQGKDCSEAVDGKTAPVRPQAALVAMDSHTGEILALISGRDTEFDYATMARRDEGSMQKPFYYLKALEDGSWNGTPFTAATVIDPEGDRLIERCGSANLGVRSVIREAVAKSYNFAACAASQSAGIPVEFVGAVTKTDPKRQLASAIGETAEGSLIDLVSAYSIFANNGVRIPFTPFKSADRDGQPLNLVRPLPEKVADAGASYVVTDLLRSTVERGGTLQNVRSLASLPNGSYDLAGKTGTAQVATLWAVILTPRLIVGVAVMMPKNEVELTMKEGFTGGRVAGPIAAKFLRFVKDYQPSYLDGKFDRPENLQQLNIDPSQGCVAAHGGRPEFFIIGREAPKCQ